MEKRTILGNFIHSTWTSLNIRAGKYRHLQTKNKCESYKDINVTMSLEEYKSFCKLNEMLILSLKRPSLDRINNTKNYEISNLQIIELRDNIGKNKLVFHNGKGICSICKKEKEEDLFCSDKRRLNGKSTICKSCENSRGKLRYKIRTGK